MDNKFYRDRENRLFLGIVAGLCKKYNWDLQLARGITVLLILFTNAPFILAYFIIALVTEER